MRDGSEDTPTHYYVFMGYFWNRCVIEEYIMQSIQSLITGSRLYEVFAGSYPAKTAVENNSRSENDKVIGGRHRVLGFYTSILSGIAHMKYHLISI